MTADEVRKRAGNLEQHPTTLWGLKANFLWGVNKLSAQCKPCPSKAALLPSLCLVDVCSWSPGVPFLMCIVRIGLRSW